VCPAHPTGADRKGNYGSIERIVGRPTLGFLRRICWCACDSWEVRCVSSFIFYTKEEQ